MLLLAAPAHQTDASFLLISWLQHTQHTAQQQQQQQQQQAWTAVCQHSIRQAPLQAAACRQQASKHATGSNVLHG
jgi:Na+-translocating ferredoxin:NAD+ oxidoreductase RnfG subunit